MLALRIDFEEVSNAALVCLLRERQTRTNFLTKEIEDEYDTLQQDWTRDVGDARE
jgi:homoserine trans-succinylase